jgi:hypothetical protein
MIQQRVYNVFVNAYRYIFIILLGNSSPVFVNTNISSSMMNLQLVTARHNVYCAPALCLVLF